MGATGDRRYIEDLRPMLTDETPGVRYQAASSLVELGDNTGFPVLVAGLADGDIRNRYKCFEELQRATGQDFGYQHDAAPETRHASTRRPRCCSRFANQCPTAHTASTLHSPREE